MTNILKLNFVVCLGLAGIHNSFYILIGGKTHGTI